MGKNQNGLINHAPALSKGGKSLNDYSEVLINHLNQYSIENYGEPIDEESFMILGNTDSKVKSVFAETKSGVDINIPVSKLYDTYEGGGSTEYEFDNYNKPNDTYCSYCVKENIDSGNLKIEYSDYQDFLFGYDRLSDSEKKKMSNDLKGYDNHPMWFKDTMGINVFKGCSKCETKQKSKFEPYIFNDNEIDRYKDEVYHSGERFDLDEYGEGGKVLIQIIDNKSEADELISTLRSENPSNTYVIENYKGSYAVTETYKGGGEIEYDTNNVKGESKIHKNNTHFAIHKPTNSIAYSWEYKGYESEELNGSKDDYFWYDVKDTYEGNVDKFKKSDFAIVTRKTLEKRGIDLNDYKVFQGQKYISGGEIKEIENDEIEGLLMYGNYEDYSARELKSMSDYHYENKPPLDIVEKMWGIAIEHCNLRWDSPILAFNVGIGDLFKFVDPLDINYIVGYESNEIQRTICDTLYKKNGYPIAIGNDISILNNPRLPSSFKLAIGFDLGTDTFYSNTLHQSIVRDGYMVAILPSKIFNGEGGQYEKKREILNTYYDLVVAYELPSDTMNGFTLVALRKI